MYKKLSGMTGTAKTEATEFTEIYGLNIVTVPTNRPNIRKDYPDAVYKTVNGKYKAVIEQVLECHKNGQPVLVGTVSVEKSETLAKMLQKYTRDFNVLNAKNHEREAEIVAQAGKKGAITKQPTWQAVVLISCWAATPSSWPRPRCAGNTSVRTCSTPKSRRMPTRMRWSSC